MRITKEQAEIIKKNVAALVVEPHKIWLFGSRADDNLRGGDVDLFIETHANLENKVAMIGKIYAKLIMVLGDREIDVLLKDAQSKEQEIFAIARKEGKLL
jgi:predicted nucleotidyltransferase